MQDAGVDELISADEGFASAVIEGLSKTRKSLPCRYLYDARGSELFEQITRLDEYYPTRVETGILHRYAGELAERTADQAVLVEFGSGASHKTEIIIEATPHLAAYVPIDVSVAALEDARTRLQQKFPCLTIVPHVGDFGTTLKLPPDLQHRPRFGFFPGSTIGNFTRDAAVELLRKLAASLGAGSRLVLGVDLVKDPDVLENAYDDSEGVTAEFNLNLLQRINRELAGTFDATSFQHRAEFDEDQHRIDMYLESEVDQAVSVLGRRFQFARGERIHTEHSHKYTIDGARDLLRRAGLTPVAVWTDADDLFSVHEVIV